MTHHATLARIGVIGDPPLWRAACGCGWGGPVRTSQAEAADDWVDAHEEDTDA